MQVPLQVTMRNIDHSTAVEQRIRAKAKKLDVFFDRIISCSVVAEKVPARSHGGALYNIRLHLLMPRKELIVNKNQQEDLYVAIRDAFEDMVRQIEQAAHIMHGDIKKHSLSLRGQIIRLFFNDQFGFIITSEGNEFYFNSDNLVRQNRFNHLKIGTPVHFIERMGDEGPRACRVSVRKG